MFNATVEYRYQFQMAGGASGIGVPPVPRVPAGGTGNAAVVPGNAAAALFIRNDGGDSALLRWGAVPVAAGLGGVFLLPPGGAVVVEPNDPGLTTGSVSYVGGPLYLAWGTLIAETGAPTR